LKKPNSKRSESLNLSWPWNKSQGHLSREEEGEEEEEEEVE
jgi:hypothetical protein